MTSLPSDPSHAAADSAPRLGLRANLPQFSLLVVVNAFVGAMIGMERSILPAIATDTFGLAESRAVLSFIVVFGVCKAVTNYMAGRLADKNGRKKVLIVGWWIAAPVPFLLMWAPSWSWILFANVLLGISQGLTWSTTVIMKIDLAGPAKRGLAMGFNEFAGYGAVALSAWATSYVAIHSGGLRPEPFYLGVVYCIFGIVLSIFFVRETKAHAQAEAALAASKSAQGSSQTLSQKSSQKPSQSIGLSGDASAKEVFVHTTFTDRNLSSSCQAGLVNNLNDGMAWGLFPLVFAAAGMDLAEVGILAAIYPGVWGIGQLFTGALSDKVGRKGMIVLGMWIQGAGIAWVGAGQNFAGFALGAVLLGLGTSMVYPTLLAAIGDVSHPRWRASAVGIYRLWRDLGYAFGAILAGIIADAMGNQAALYAVAGLTFASGLWAALRMRETLMRRAL